ncbi:MAG: hypothetical protein AMXMBFR46_03460 [Acidimicrobiia bacterium]
MSDDSRADAPAVRFPILEPLGHRTVDLSLEQRYTLLQSIFRHEHLNTYRRIAERFGWEVANELAGEYGQGHTDALVDTYRRVLGLTGKGAAAVSQTFQAEIQCEGGDVEVHIESADQADVSALCGFGYLLQRPRDAGLPITDGLCETGCRLWLQQRCATVDPELRVERLTWMPDGAPRCRYTISRQEG